MSTHTVSRTSLWKVPLAGTFIILIVVSLTFLGLVVLYSASKSLATDPALLLKKQLIWLVIALICCGVMMSLDLLALRKYAYLMAGVAIFMLMLVLVPGIGVKVNGARRWIDLGPMLLQVSEIGKLGLLFALSHYLAANRRYFNDVLRGYIIPCSIPAVICGLILIEPDFGTAFLCGLVGGLMLYLAGVRLKFLIPTALAATVFFSIAVYNDPVRLRRITSFLDVEGNRGDSSYQLWQGILAFGAGGLEGVGLGAGRQQMAFLPEAHTDFIFAIVGEELGLIFTIGVVILFMLLFYVGVLQLKQAPSLYQYLLIMGSLLFVTLQALINIGVVTGCLPTKGMSLPFISYGGSNLVFMFILIGIILNGFRAWEAPEMPIQREL